MVPKGDVWTEYLLSDYSFADFERGVVVLDIGCGTGAVLSDLERRGCVASGLDTDRGSLATCRGLGLRVMQARAEQMPVRTGSQGGLVCKVVMPYTDEARALAEMGRVLQPGGRGVLCYHGAGYYLRYLLLGPSWKLRFYALKTLVNTWVYVKTAKRLPGFMGDTIYQSRHRLARYYRQRGLKLLREDSARRFLGFPVFIYHTIQKAT